MANEQLDDPVATVIAFAKAYTQWERDMNKMPDSLNSKTMKARHAKVIKDYCTPKKRAYVDGILAYRSPSTYAKVIKKNIAGTENVTKSRIHVETKKLPDVPDRAYRFVMLKKKDGWRIDSEKSRPG